MSAVASLLETLVQESKVERDLKEYRDRQEAGDAELFAFMFQNQIIYDHSERLWYVWRGNYWERDRNGEICRKVISRLAPAYMRASAESLEGGRKEDSAAFAERAQALLKRRRIDNVLALARNMEELALAGDEWDNNPLLLGVNNGVIDLTTGTHRTGAPAEYIRAHCPIDWLGADYPAPHWERFLFEVFDGDVGLINFIQRLFGYCLTGKTTEHRLPILYGEGRNGKSTLLQALAYVFGRDLSHTTQADALMDLKRDGTSPQPFIYALRRRRLVWATESREGHRINAGLIKQLTGGDTITTRTLFTDVTTFNPTHKVMLVTNHKPHISAEDQAMWDRVLLIPFDLRFVEEPKAPKEFKRNPRLLEILQEESPGILAWLVRGCLAWQVEGLNPPTNVITATEEYRQDEDTIGEFILDCLVQGDDKSATAKDIYSRYTEWAKANGTEHMSQIALGKRLKRRFGEPTRNMHGNVYKGVGVLK